MTIFSFIFRSIRKVRQLVSTYIDNYISLIKLKGNGAFFKSGLKSRGVPHINIHRSGKLIIGNNFVMNNGNHHNTIGRQQACILIVGPHATITIGDNVGISGTAIVCHRNIKIGNYVKIGGNTVIYDTDFHSLRAEKRRVASNDKKNTNHGEVIIGDDVFIGAHSTILKNVTIGNGSIVGACSVVTRDIPPNQIWGGNPAKFLRNNTTDGAN